MRNRRFLPIFLLAFALAAPAVVASPHPGAAVFTEKGDKDKQDKKDKKKDRKRKEDDRGRRGAQGIPPGHLPPPGECRVWHDGEPPGHQPPAMDCATARREAARTGGRVIYGDDRGEDRWDDDDDDGRWEDCDRWNDCDEWGDRDRWDDRWVRGFDGLDRNDDGYLSRSEWTGGDRIFDLLDRNEDGRLSRNEVRDARSQSWEPEDRQARLENRFRNSDDNRDGRLSRNEWWGRADTFERLDRNNDGYLGWTEIWGRRSSR